MKNHATSSSYAYLRLNPPIDQMLMSGMFSTMYLWCPLTHVFAEVSRSLIAEARRARSNDTSGDVKRWLREGVRRVTDEGTMMEGELFKIAREEELRSSFPPPPSHTLLFAYVLILVTK